MTRPPPRPAPPVRPAPPARRRPGQRARLEPRAVLEAACALIAEQGYFDFSFQQLARRLGVSQTAVMHYFPSRDLLARAVIDHVLLANHGMVSASAGIEDDALTRLQKHFHGNEAWARRHPAQASVILLFYYLGSVDPAYASLYREVLARARLRIQELVLAAVREKSIAPAVAPALAAELLHDSLLASLLNRVSTQDRAASGLHAKWRAVFSTLLRPTAARKN